MECKIERRKVVTHTTLHKMVNDEAPDSQTVEVVPCGSPIFSDELRARGICSSCAKGWQVEGNRFTPAGIEQLAKHGVTCKELK